MSSHYDCSEVTDVCLVENTIYGYRPSLPANAFFLALFLVCTIVQIAQGISWKTWTYMVALACGCLIEAIGMISETPGQKSVTDRVLGYTGRVIMNDNPYSDLGFKIQICCLIMGPAFLAAGIYLTLKHLVKAFGRQYSWLRPKWYTWLFIGCDCISLTFQAAGGGLASSAEDDDKQMILGNNLAITGIIAQVVTLVIFAALASFYFIRRHQLKDTREGSDPLLRTLRFRMFLGAVLIAFLTTFIRCVYRIPEMMGGWGNPLMQNEREFIILDST